MSGREMKFDDPNWASMLGGYRIPYDPRRALLTLEEGKKPASAWRELWDNLHHQGDVGEASYAAVPHLVRIYAASGRPDWNIYALVATIDDARREGRNPLLPTAMRDAYEFAWEELAELGLREVRIADDPTLIRSIIAVLAIWKGHLALGRLALTFDENELGQFLADVASH